MDGQTLNVLDSDWRQSIKTFKTQTLSFIEWHCVPCHVSSLSLKYALIKLRWNSAKLLLVRRGQLLRWVKNAKRRRYWERFNRSSDCDKTLLSYYEHVRDLWTRRSSNPRDNMEPKLKVENRHFRIYLSNALEKHCNEQMHDAWQCTPHTRLCEQMEPANICDSNWAFICW